MMPVTLIFRMRLLMVGDVHVAHRIRRDADGHVQLGLCRWTAVAGEAHRARAGDGRYDSVGRMRRMVCDICIEI